MNRYETLSIEAELRIIMERVNLLETQILGLFRDKHKQDYEQLQQKRVLQFPSRRH